MSCGAVPGVFFDAFVENLVQPWFIQIQLGSNFGAAVTKLGSGCL